MNTHEPFDDVEEEISRLAEIASRRGTREGERETVEHLPNGDLRVTDILGRTARLHWSRFHGLIVSMDTRAVYLGQPETLAWIALCAGHVHPAPEWEYGSETHLHNGTTIVPVADKAQAERFAWLHPMYKRQAPGPWVPVEAGQKP